MNPTYLLGNTDREHERLIRQARHLAPFTERLFRDAGIGPGQSVLDLGSGLGDVAMLVAQLVGPTGRVVGVDLDGAALAKARARAAAAGFRNVVFIESDVGRISNERPFDAAVGRFILQFLPDPVEVLRDVQTILRPGAVVCFQEVSWESLLAQTEHLLLRSACVALVRDAIRGGGARTDMALTLFQGFQAAGLPVPSMRLEMPLGSDADTRAWLYDLLCTVRPRIEEQKLSPEALGDLDTLSARLDAELLASNSFAGWVGLVGAWALKADR